MLTIDVTTIHGTPPPVPMSASFDEAGGTIGRDSGCTLVLPDPEKRISRRHALITFSGGGYRLRNQGSAIAVQVNGVPVDYGSEVPLAAGDRIEIGEFAMQARAVTSVAGRASAQLQAPAPEPAQPDDILAGFGPGAGAGDPFADLIPAPRPPASPPPARLTPVPAPARARESPTTPTGMIPDDFDPFAEAGPAPTTPPESLGIKGRGDFEDLVPPRENRVDELFGLHSGDPFPPGHPLAVPSAAATPGPAGIDDLLMPGAPTDQPRRRFDPAQRDDAPELSSPMRLPEVLSATAAGEAQARRTDSASSVPSQQSAPERDAESAEGPGTVGGMRLSWDDRTGDGLFDGKKTAVIGAPTQERRRGERRRSSAAPGAAPATQGAAAADAVRMERDLLQALLDGLGLERWPAEQEFNPEALRRLGGLLRVAVQGTIDLLRARALIKSEVQAQLTMIVSRDNNPLKFSPNAEAALAHLLGPAQRGFMSGNSAMEDAYRDLVAHQFGFTAGTRAALSNVLKRFDPAELESRLAARSMLDALMPAHRKARLWDLFTERFAQISSEAEDDFQRLLGKEFLRAYEEQVARMSEPGRPPEG